MRKLFRSRKALSPVVAAIILIAVTVAVSIAVAAWMGALSFTFMKTEELKFLGHEWATPPTTIDIIVKNSGTAPLKIAEVRVNDVPVLATSLSFTAITAGAPTDGTLNPGDEVSVTIPSTYSPGTKYAFEFRTVAGNRFGPYTALAPS